MLIEKIVSITGSNFFPGAGPLIGNLKPGQGLLLQREPDNKYDPNAVAVYRGRGSSQLGYLPRGVAVEIAPVIDAGLEVTARKASGKWATSWGVITLAYQGAI